MEKSTIGALFILFGFVYGSLAIDPVYNHTLGFLIERGFIKPPAGKPADMLLGRKPAIYLYSLAFIIIGIFILWNRNL